MFNKKAVYENKRFDKKLKNQTKKGSPSVGNTTRVSPTSIRNNALITSSAGFSVSSLPSQTTSVKNKNDTSKPLSMPGDTSNTETTTVEPDFSEKENSEDYAVYLEKTVYEESELVERWAENGGLF